MKETLLVVVICMFATFASIVFKLVSKDGGTTVEPVLRQCIKCGEMNSAEPDSLVWACSRCGTIHFISSGVPEFSKQ